MSSSLLYTDFYLDVEPRDLRMRKMMVFLFALEILVFKREQIDKVF